MVTLLTTPPASVAHAPLGDDHRSIRPVLAHGHRAAGRAPIHPVLDVPTTIVVMITIPKPHGRTRRVDAHRLRKRGRCDCKRRCGCSHRQKNTHVVVPPKRRRHAAVRCISAAGGIGSNAPQFLANGPLKLERKKPRTCGASCSPVLRGAGGSATGEHTSILCTHHGSTPLFSRAIFSRRTRSLVALRIPKFEQLGAEPCTQLPKIGCVASQPRSCIVSAGRLEDADREW